MLELYSSLLVELLSGQQLCC